MKQEEGTTPKHKGRAQQQASFEARRRKSQAKTDSACHSRRTGDSAGKGQNKGGRKKHGS